MYEGNLYGPKPSTGMLQKRRVHCATPGGGPRPIFSPKSSEVIKRRIVFLFSFCAVCIGKSAPFSMLQ
jgi:hypothetical protein